MVSCTKTRVPLEHTCFGERANAGGYPVAPCSTREMHKDGVTVYGRARGRTHAHAHAHAHTADPTHLAIGIKVGHQSAADGIVEIGVVKDEERRLAAKLHGDRLERLRRIAHHRLSSGRLARERDLPGCCEGTSARKGGQVPGQRLTPSHPAPTLAMPVWADSCWPTRLSPAGRRSRLAQEVSATDQRNRSAGVGAGNARRSRQGRTTDRGRH